MIKKILVPLDGSKLAECALPYAEELAGKLGSGVALVSITKRGQGFWPDEDPSERSEERLIPVAVCNMEEQAAKYLDNTAKGLEKKGIKVLKEVICGKAAEEIINYADTRHIDLIVMSSHGRKGPGKWLRSSVAQKVLKGACIPVMLIRAPGCSL
jgi:nucleotide-binding universal stress UspA family protein